MVEGGGGVRSVEDGGMYEASMPDCFARFSTGVLGIWLLIQLVEGLECR